MRKSLFVLPLIAFSLFSCANNESSKEKEDVLPDDSLLEKHEELNGFYDNDIVLPAVGSGESTFAADPFVLRYNGKYYLYPTTSGGAVRCYVSDDLITWEKAHAQGLDAGYCYQYSKDNKAPEAQIPFAPEVIYYNGFFYMITSPSGRGHYVLKSEHPEGPFKCVSNNIQSSIDGSYFVDGDGKVYMFNAGGGSIILNEMENDFKTISNTIPLTECVMGNWNEGPYMLKKDGNCYLTYCGTHYLSPSYRVNYSFVPEGKSISSASSYINKGNVLIETNDAGFNGLGHSMTVLGPDLDSYYMIYHNLKGERSTRHLDLSRLSFNGSRMVVNDVRKEKNILPNTPDFESVGDENFTLKKDKYLSDVKTDKTFTAEYNLAGNGTMIFSYIDEDNYSTLNIKNTTLTLNLIKKGDKETVFTKELFEEFDSSYNHTYRISYKDNKADLYVDSMEIANDIEVSLNEGKIGYFNNFDEIGYSAFSKYGQGSSDSSFYNQKLVLANAYVPELSILRGESGLKQIKEGEYLDAYANNINLLTTNDRATYRFFTLRDGIYDLNIRVPYKMKDKVIGVKIDNEEVVEFETFTDNFVDNGDSYINLGKLDLVSGQHYISFVNTKNDVMFSEFKIEPEKSNKEINITFNENTNLEDFKFMGSKNLSANGLDLDIAGGTGNAIILQNEYGNNFEYETKFKINEIRPGGFIGVAFNIEEFAVNYHEDPKYRDDPNGFRGFKIELSSDSARLKYNDFEVSDMIMRKDFNPEDYDEICIKVVQTGRTITAYLNDKKLFNITPNLGSLSGKVGIIAANSQYQVKSISCK